MLCSVICLRLYSPRFLYPQSPACRPKQYLARLDKPSDLNIKTKAAKHRDFHQTKRRWQGNYNFNGKSCELGNEEGDALDETLYRQLVESLLYLATKRLDISFVVCIISRCDYYDLSNKLIPYMDAWTWQKQMVEDKHALMEADEDVSDIVVILQHPPVYTLGTRSSDEFLHFDIHSPPYDIYRTERGGEVTYHGPGQLVMYPIMNLHYHKMDLHWYLRSLEEVIVRALWSAFSLQACRIDGLTGVWVGNQKVAAIGIRVSRWVTYHGLAINVTTDLTPFTKIVPCGISDRSVGSLFEILKSSASVRHVASPNLEGCEETWDSCTLLDLTHKSLLKEFSEVFQLDLIPKFGGNLSCMSTSNIREPLI